MITLPVFTREKARKVLFKLYKGEKVSESLVDDMRSYVAHELIESYHVMYFLLIASLILSCDVTAYFLLVLIQSVQGVGNLTTEMWQALSPSAHPWTIGFITLGNIIALLIKGMVKVAEAKEQNSGNFR